jgi:hypothetical protein
MTRAPLCSCAFLRGWVVDFFVNFRSRKRCLRKMQADWIEEVSDTHYGLPPPLFAELMLPPGEQKYVFGSEMPVGFHDEQEQHQVKNKLEKKEDGGDAAHGVPENAHMQEEGLAEKEERQVENTSVEENEGDAREETKEETRTWNLVLRCVEDAMMKWENWKEVGEYREVAFELYKERYLAAGARKMEDGTFGERIHVAQLQRSKWHSKWVAMRARVKNALPKKKKNEKRKARKARKCRKDRAGQAGTTQDQGRPAAGRRAREEACRGRQAAPIEAQGRLTPRERSGPLAAAAAGGAERDAGRGSGAAAAGRGVRG